jgi:hypothetical protein
MTCFTGEKFTTGQERFAPWCSAPQAVRDGHETGHYHRRLV